MPFRELLRGHPPDETVTAIAEETARHQGMTFGSVEVLNVDNWLSLPLVVNNAFFVKVLSQRNALVQRLLTAGRNLGAASTGTGRFFRAFDTPAEMATHEFEATTEMIAAGVNAPEPLETFEHDDHGVVVFEYIPQFETLKTLTPTAVERLAPQLFAMLSCLHDAGLAHGDLRAENVLVVGEELYFIDATRVDAGAAEDARAYDLACALAALEPHVGAATAVDAAAASYTEETLLPARRYLEFVNVRPDHDFDVAELRRTLDTRGD
ncbi:MAG: Mn2+-dependent serine/threonine protein kinase [halophilic archaeon J07HX5]|nr:MAG: Mn2+-dependent serine/threonine protein kinase [halophilic archaeon J07HX5]